MTYRHLTLTTITCRKEGTKTISVDLKWSRGRVYDQMTASALYMMCVEDERKEYNPKGVVIHKQEKDTSK